MLIELNAVAASSRMIENLGRQGVVIRRAMAYERGQVMGRVHEIFNERCFNDVI